MDFKDRTPTEALSTYRTFVGLLSSMDSPVQPQVSLAPELLPALRAFVGLLPRVDPFMRLKVFALTEAFPAH